MNSDNKSKLTQRIAYLVMALFLCLPCCFLMSKFVREVMSESFSLNTNMILWGLFLLLVGSFSLYYPVRQSD